MRRVKKPSVQVQALGQVAYFMANPKAAHRRLFRRRRYVELLTELREDCSKREYSDHDLDLVSAAIDRALRAFGSDVDEPSSDTGSNAAQSVEESSESQNSTSDEFVKILQLCKVISDIIAREEPFNGAEISQSAVGEVQNLIMRCR